MTLLQLSNSVCAGSTWVVEELKWLARLLGERWGGEWAVSVLADGGLGVRPTGKSIAGGIISLLPLELPASTGNIPCGCWQPRGTLRGPLDGQLVTPGVASPADNMVVRDDEGYRLQYNPLALAYWCLTRQEEICRQDLDNFERFPARSSHAFRYGYLMRPVVDEWLEVLGQVADLLWPRCRRLQARPAIELSHDVDLPGRYAFATTPRLLRRMAGDLILRRDPRSLLMAPLARFGSSRQISHLDPHNQFDWMMDQAESAGCEATYYFLCGKTDPRYDADYEPEHPAIRHLMRTMHERGHHIGLHPSFNTFRNVDAMRVEAERLRLVCRQEGITQTGLGARMHYLRWAQPETQRAIAAAGLAHDASLSYADHAGFRCGTCIEYEAFDPIARRPLPLRVRPLVAMEASVIEPSYMAKGLGGEALQVFLALRRACAGVGGTFSLLWHNSRLTSAEERVLYQKVLKG